MRVNMTPAGAKETTKANPEGFQDATVPIDPSTHLYSPKEAAAYLEMKYYTFQYYVKTGRLKADGHIGTRRPGRFYRLETLRAFKLWIAENRRRPGNPNWIRQTTILD